MFLGTDPVQVDTYGCQLMGLALEDVPYIQLAERYGAGTTRLDDVIALNTPEQTTSYPAPAGIAKRLTKNVNIDSACSACFASLVRGLYVAKESVIPVHHPISIGQGFRGKEISGIGIGNCCLGADFCVEGCPPTAKAVEKMLRELS